MQCSLQVGDVNAYFTGKGGSQEIGPGVTNGGTGLTITSILADHIAGTRPGDLPPSASEMAKRVLLDETGVMIGASGLAPEARPFVEMARSGGEGPARILGTPYEVTAPSAAFANGAFAHALDFEDAFELSPGHPNASLVPALLALAQAHGPVDGPRFLTALAVGCDIACRMALALDRPMEAGGWYPPPILAGFGAVAGAANLMGLDATATRNAISLMMCQTTMPGEIKYASGSDLRAVREAFPAQAAVISALLAKQGVTGFEQPLEGPAGFYALYADGQFDPSRLTDRLGEKYWIEELTFKPWPSCRGTHAFIEMIFDLQQSHGFAVEDLEKIVCHTDSVHQMLFEPESVRRQPSTAIEAKFSIPFCVALALVRKRVTLDDFAPVDLADPQLLSMGRKVHNDPVQTHPWDAGRGGGLTLQLASGRILSAEIRHALGSPENPLSKASLVDKFVMCAGKAADPIGETDARNLAARILALETCEDVGALF